MCGVNEAEEILPKLSLLGALCILCRCYSVYIHRVQIHTEYSLQRAVVWLSQCVVGSVNSIPGLYYRPQNSAWENNNPAHGPSS